MWVFWDVMLSCWLFSDISKEFTTFTIRIKQPKTLKASKSFQMLWITCSMIQFHIQQDLHLQQQCCEILKFHRHLFSPKPNQSPTHWVAEALLQVLSSGAWSWPLTSIQYLDYACMKPHIHPTHLPSMMLNQAQKEPIEKWVCETVNYLLRIGSTDGLSCTGNKTSRFTMSPTYGTTQHHNQGDLTAKGIHLNQSKLLHSPTII